ncbi:MAG TPA: GNAT family N-acetyltransferase [Rhodopila sp.]|nr:GNAT family N-acetyltransferase [Rhodopila sp.]
MAWAPLAATDTPPPAMFDVLLAALHASAYEATGPVEQRHLAVPIYDDHGMVIGGLWASTLLTWLNIEMLFVPAALRRCGTGSALIHSAEAEAAARGCRHAIVDTFNPHAALFYQALGFVRFGELDDFPPGHRRIFFQKALAATA